MHILIVDDQPRALQQLQDLLLERWSDIEIYRAGHVNLALRILQEKQVDLIITDWQMPDANGLDLIRQVQTRWPNVPTIIYSGMKISPEDLKLALETGAVDYLRKPLDPLEFQARVYNVLRLVRMQRSLQQRDTSKNIFFSLLSHHLINDAWQLKTALEMLQKQQLKHNFDYYEKMLRSAQAVSADHHHLITQLLSLSQLLFQDHPADLQACPVQQCLLSCQTLGEPGQIKVRANAELRVLADPQMLLRILTELTQNAVAVSAGRPVRLSARLQQERIEIQVKDMGPGLSASALTTYLTPLFSRADSREGFALRGLGLPICHELLRLLGSRLHGESTPEGCVFGFYLEAVT
jgi:DNA-binding response OmpR family regulator/anti-sigma regulatory factor (Ser/Thr protein kinase)